MSYPLKYAEIEDALLSLLDPLRTSQGVVTLRDYRGEFSQDSRGEVVIDYPAVLVHVPEMNNESMRREDQRETIVEIYFGDADSRGNLATGRPGVYALVEAAREILNRRQVENAGTLLLFHEITIGYSRLHALCVVQAEYKLITRVNLQGELTLS